MSRGDHADFINDGVIVVTNVRKLTLRNGQSRRPLITQDIQTNRPVRIDVRMVDLCRERHLWRLERIIRGEHNGQEEDTTRVRRISLKPTKTEKYEEQMSVMKKRLIALGRCKRCCMTNAAHRPRLWLKLIALRRR